MYVRQLVGSKAGTIIEMPYDVGKTAIKNGTASAVSTDDLSEAKIETPKGPIVDDNDMVPSGYRIEPDPVAGFNVLDPGGVALNKQPFQNIPAARCYAQTHYYHATHQSELALVPPEPVEPPARAVAGNKAAAPAPENPKASREAK